jgi:RloB-like protein
MPNKKNNFRGYSERKVGNREIRETFLIVCEGEKTEPNYFKSFRVVSARIYIEGFGANPSKLIEEAKRLNDREEGYDQVWCVFDRDDFPKQDFNNAIINAEREGFKVAYSNEAFELWYVLHFEFLNTGIPRKDYIHKLDKLLKHQYKKNSEEIYDEIKKHQATAIKNAENLLNQYQPKNAVNDNPSTTVHLLVKELNRFIS